MMSIFYWLTKLDGEEKLQEIKENEVFIKIVRTSETNDLKKE